MSLKSSFKNEVGGLSGTPLFLKSTLILKKMYSLTKGQIPLIGVGGISNGLVCYEKIKAGASLVQLYSSMVYKGPGVVEAINNELAKLVREDNFSSISEAVGSDHQA